MELPNMWLNSAKGNHFRDWMWNHKTTCQQSSFHHKEIIRGKETVLQILSWLHHSRSFLKETKPKGGRKRPSSSSLNGSADKELKVLKNFTLHFFFGHIYSFLESHLQRGIKCICLKMKYYLLNNSFYSINDIYYNKRVKYTQGKLINVMGHCTM